MKTIAEHLREYIESDSTLSGPGGIFNGRDFLAMEKVLSGKADNFIIFNNAGGRPFHIWSFSDLKGKGSTLAGFKKFAESQRGLIYMQKIEGVETVFKNLPMQRARDIWQETVDILAK